MRELDKQSLKAVTVAAYGGAVLIFALDITGRISEGGDARICPLGSLTDLCTIGEIGLAYLLVPIWAIFAFPFAVMLCLPIGLGLGRLTPLLEDRLSARNVEFLQYLLATMAGFGVMFAFSALDDGGNPWVMGFAGFLTGALAVGIFRRARYPQPVQDVLRREPPRP